MEINWTRQLLCIVTLILLAQSSESSSETVTPANVTDTYSNHADINSNITWASVPSGASYPAETPYDDAGLGALYSMATGFINIVGSTPLPYDAVASLIRGGGFEINSFISYGIGWGICIGIGILFILIMPIVACCFCCCRCCGNCGGKMEHKGHHDDDAMCRKVTYSILLLVCTTFMMIAIICVYVTNDKVSASLGTTGTTLNETMTTVNTYVNNTVEQINYVAIKDFEFARKVIDRDLDNIGVLVGVPVRTTLATTGNVDNAINSIIALDATIQDLATKLIAVNTSVAVFKEKGNILISELNSTATNISNTISTCGAQCSSINPNQLQMSADLNQLPDISSQVSQIDSVMSNNITALALDGKKQFDDIPERVTNETRATVTSIKIMLSNFTTTISSSLSVITTMTGMISNLSSSLNPVYTGLDQAKQYDSYRNYGGIGLSCLLLLIVIFQFIGLVMGICGHKKVTPTERSGVSNCGGLFLMAAVGLCFIFSVFLMLFVVIMFPIGGILEKEVCQPLTDDPTYSSLGKLVDNSDSLISTVMFGSQGGYVMGILLGNTSIPLTLGGVLTDCKNDMAAYTALKLNNMFDISSVTNYRSQIDITTQLDSLNVDLSTVTILSSNTETQLTDFHNSLDINFQGFLDQTNQSTTQVDLNAFANELRNLSANLMAINASAFGTVAAELNYSADSLDSIQSTTVPAVNNAQTQITTNIENLAAAAPVAQTTVNNTLNNTRTAQTYIQTNGSGVVVDEAKNYANRILGVADQFVARALSAVSNDVGKCKPVYTIFNSFFNTLFCGNVVDTLNGFWFTLGWYVFFMVPSIIFGVKLAKHFRRMNFEITHEDPRTDSQESMNSEKKPGFGNKDPEFFSLGPVKNEVGIA
ncbi:prominin-1-A isoform X2 [Lingula anatina]|uniref:Prominin-1-A isoform X2 n=1 Tax=Lingula anatina TaxID=7574 RepID=A0A1S3IHW0_LINAN|nr:prominin-1-A isoform X2 [Lingula anatina]|eukprot:XP_013397802.1 prominin-1-A isoform X2 [Lingula anatina]